MAEATKPDKTRQLSIEQQNAIDHLIQGKSDRSTAEAVGVSRQTVWEWRNKDPLFIAELNRQRAELWSEARERLKSLANRALDVLESQLSSNDSKASLAAAKYVLQGTSLLGDMDLTLSPMTPEDVIFRKLKREAWAELSAKAEPGEFRIFSIEQEAEALAKSRLKKALAEAGL